MSTPPFYSVSDQEEVPIAETCFMLGTEPIASLTGSELHAAGSAMLFLNGTLLGVHRRPHSLVRAIRCGQGGPRETQAPLTHCSPHAPCCLSPATRGDVHLLQSFSFHHNPKHPAPSRR